MIRPRFLLILVLVVLASVAGLTQNYGPKQGETVLKLAVEGRGNIFIHLHVKEAPKTTKHIIDLVKRGFYDGQRFHKVVTSPRKFLAQIGDPQTKTKDIDDPSIGEGGSGQTVPYEDSKFSNVVGAVGLSTLPKNRDSGDSQFYINLAQNGFLDGSYTVFGKVVGGMDVVNKLQKGDRVTKMTILEAQ